MKFKPFLLLLLFLPLTVLAQRSYTVSGTVTDQRNGETLIGATVLDTRSGKGTVTNLYGHYSLTFDLGLNRNTELNVQMRRSVTLNEVTVTAERTGDVRSSQMSAMDMPVEKIKAVPVLFGEADIIKALQLMPGVQSGSEGNSGMEAVPTRTSSCSTACRSTMSRISAASSLRSTPTPSRT